MTTLLAIPEIRALDDGSAVLRIPDQQQVPLTDRVRRLIDTPEFRRLSNVSQLGLVSLVYPGATHSRFEHSLGVYRKALLFLRHFATNESFASIVSNKDAELFIATALLHDLAHWPYCHPIEDLNLEGVPHHEKLFEARFESTAIENCLQTDWQLSVADVSGLLDGKSDCQSLQILHSMLSGPFDTDKMDYLYRDSLHAGVPYGRNFDSQRLLDSMCLNETQNGIAITDKGQTAAELMVFARYVMFSEVYWHHAVRSATAMYQRAFYELFSSLELDRLFTSSDSQAIHYLFEVVRSTKSPAESLLEGIFGPSRQLYKRVAEFNCLDNEKLFRKMAYQPYSQLVSLSGKLAQHLEKRIGRSIKPTEILIDAAPTQLEVQFDIQIKRLKANSFSTLGQMSPVVKTLATDQFDDLVKKVRIFAPNELARSLDSVEVQNSLAELIL